MHLSECQSVCSRRVASPSPIQVGSIESHSGVTDPQQQKKRTSIFHHQLKSERELKNRESRLSHQTQGRKPSRRLAGQILFWTTLFPFLTFENGVGDDGRGRMRREVVIHYFRTPGLTEAATDSLLRKSRKSVSQKIEKIETEFCYNIQITSEFTKEQKTVRDVPRCSRLGSDVAAE